MHITAKSRSKIPTYSSKAASPHAAIQPILVRMEHPRTGGAAEPLRSADNLARLCLLQGQGNITDGSCRKAAVSESGQLNVYLEAAARVDDLYCLVEFRVQGRSLVAAGIVAGDRVWRLWKLVRH